MSSADAMTDDPGMSKKRKASELSSFEVSEKENLYVWCDSRDVLGNAVFYMGLSKSGSTSVSICFPLWVGFSGNFLCAPKTDVFPLFSHFQWVYRGISNDLGADMTISCHSRALRGESCQNNTVYSQKCPKMRHLHSPKKLSTPTFSKSGEMHPAHSKNKWGVKYYLYDERIFDKRQGLAMEFYHYFDGAREWPTKD